MFAERGDFAEEESEAIEHDEERAAFVSDDASGERDFPGEGEADEDEDNAEGDGQVLVDDGSCDSADVERDDEVLEAIVHEDEVGLFHGCVGSASAHGDADMASGEGGCVIDAIADHDDVAALALQARDGVELLVGVESGVDVLDFEFFAERLCGFGAIAGEDNGEESPLADGSDHLFGGDTDFVAEPDATGGVGGSDPDF